MPRAFADISFTDSVRAAQARYGSRTHMEGFERASDPRNSLREADIAFISTRDSFYQASVGENGWPYVQHRGGPAGFLRVLDARTIGYADFSGNAQYISVGNINADERVSLILMDYPRRRRLKLWGRARIVHADDAPDVMAQLTLPAHLPPYPAEVERGVLIHIEAIEWNCPQHITPRYTEAELQPMLAPLLAELEQLRAQVASQQPSQEP